MGRDMTVVLMCMAAAGTEQYYNDLEENAKRETTGWKRMSAVTTALFYWQATYFVHLNNLTVNKIQGLHRGIKAVKRPFGKFPRPLQAIMEHFPTPHHHDPQPPHYLSPTLWLWSNHWQPADVCWVQNHIRIHIVAVAAAVFCRHCLCMETQISQTQAQAQSQPQPQAQLRLAPFWSVLWGVPLPPMST